MFFANDKASSSVHDTDVYSIFDIMEHDADAAPEPVDQLTLAHKAALATLQYNGTP